jgi:hypothetical protein
MKKNIITTLILLLCGVLYPQNRTEEKNAIINYFNQNLLRDRVYPQTDSIPQKSFFETKGRLNKITSTPGSKTYLMNGNRITTQVSDDGGIGPGHGLLRNVNNVVWRGVGYIFQFSPFVASEVIDEYTGLPIHIVSDGLWDYPSLREVSPTGDSIWMWKGLPGYSDPSSPDMASNPAADKDSDGKPDSWPREWYNPILGRYVWPGYLSQDATNADLEVIWAMDDRNNSEFSYFPFPNDHSRRGLGIQIDGRALQWSNALAENAIFFVYTIANVSDKDLDKIYFGMYGDPDLGGGQPVDPSAEVQDDHGFFIPPYNYDGLHPVENIPVYSRSMSYFWDDDSKGHLGLPVGYLGCKYLESPGNPDNGIDDDGDEMIDESQEDQIDNDGDWRVLTDDVGLDGIAGTEDEGEGDGVPTRGRRMENGLLDPLFPGEPNFELTDLDEADQVGLTSFNSWVWNADQVKNDESMWNRVQAGNFSAIPVMRDIVFIYGSGPIRLNKGEIKRFSIALLLGENRDDLITTAESVQRIYNANYRFYRPPAKPTVYAVPGDKKVTLYWDTKAEESYDVITGKDFEGYVIYRSTDPNFSDIQTVTDGKGVAFFSEPLKSIDGTEAKWDVSFRDEPFNDINNNGVYDSGEPYTDVNLDGQWTRNIEDYWRGYHPVPYPRRGVQYFLGSNTGLAHSYVDSNKVINGQTYYYAVVAYDHGDSTGVPPTETTKKITIDPITSQLQFDVNTVQVIPGPRSAGYVAPAAGKFNLKHLSGTGNGKINIEVINDLKVLESGDYSITFKDTVYLPEDTLVQKNYSLFRYNPVQEKITLYETKFSNLSSSNIAKDSILLTLISGDIVLQYIPGVDYIIDYEKGLIRRTDNSNIPEGVPLNAYYKYYPVHQSTLLSSEDSNPVFDGLMLKVQDFKALTLDEANTKWIQGKTNVNFTVQKATLGTGTLYPADYEITFSSSYIDSALFLVGSVPKKFPAKFSVKKINDVQEPILVLVKELTATRDTAISVGEELVLFKPGSTGQVTETTWGVVFTRPTDTLAAPIMPTDGDILQIRTGRPFTKNDEFVFRTESGKFSTENAKSALDNIYVVPNPYVGFSDIEPTTKLPGQSRGERRIYFENLPPKCSIRIFTLSGELVQVLDHDVFLENGREFWNLLNRDGFSVAYGVYIAHIDAPGIGEKVIKFALIK